jgi:hypothetical protein
MGGGKTGSAAKATPASSNVEKVTVRQIDRFILGDILRAAAGGFSPFIGGGMTFIAKAGRGVLFRFWR